MAGNALDKETAPRHSCSCFMLSLLEVMQRRRFAAELESPSLERNLLGIPMGSPFISRSSPRDRCAKGIKIFEIQFRIHRCKRWDELGSNYFKDNCSFWRATKYLNFQHDFNFAQRRNFYPFLRSKGNTRPINKYTLLFDLKNTYTLCICNVNAYTLHNDPYLPYHNMQASDSNRVVHRQ